VLLAEEFSKHGVDLRFVKSPSVTTPEDQLLVQFQGMIAEYERTQILERSRRGNGTVPSRARSAYVHRTRVSINAITRLLNERRIPTRKAIARWE